jgi:hypothetical protein
MNRQLVFPGFVVLTALTAAGYCANSLLNQAHKQRSSNLSARRDLQNTTLANQTLQTRITGAATELAQGREFLARWESAHTGEARGGLENRFIEPANAYDVLSPTPRLEQNPSVFLQTDICRIESRNLHFAAEGRVTSLAKFYAEAERLLPTGIVRLVQLRAGERAPEINVDMAMLHRSFADMPPLPEGTPAGDPGSMPVLAKRPDVHRTAVPNLSENLIARTLSKSGQAGAASATDITQFIPDLKVTGLIWNVDGHRRALLVDGFILRQGQYIPQTMVKGKGRVLLSEVGRDFAVFTIETEELNAVTGKKEKSSLTRELHFTLFNGLTSEG